MSYVFFKKILTGAKIKQMYEQNGVLKQKFQQMPGVFPTANI